MKLENLTQPSQIERFLNGSVDCAYEVLSSKPERYEWIQSTLVRLRYMTLEKKDKGIVIRFLMKISGYSRQQLTRLARQYTKTGRIVCK